MLNEHDGDDDDDETPVVFLRPFLIGRAGSQSRLRETVATAGAIMIR